jgi:hypothetical protein
VAHQPNRVVKIVFELVDVEDEDVTGCKVYLEMPDRPIDEKVLIGDDCTVPEKWAANVFDAIRADLSRMQQENQGYVLQTPKLEDMN